MPVETAADRAIFVSANDWGTKVYPLRGNVVSFDAIFDNDFVEVEAGGVPFAMQQPRLIARTSDISTLVEDDQIKINGIIYKIKVIQADGTGMTNLVLEKQ